MKYSKLSINAEILNDEEELDRRGQKGREEFSAGMI